MIYHKQPENFTLWKDTVGCFVECGDDILLLRRVPHKTYGTQWGLPGGKLEQGEHERAGARRELQEETGIIIAENEITRITKVFVRYPDKDFTYSMFRVRLAERPRIMLHPQEHQDFRWVTPREALAMDLMPDLDACIRLVYASEHEVDNNRKT